MVSFRVDEDDFVRLDALAHQTSCSRAEVGTPPDFEEVAALMEEAQRKVDELRPIDFDAIQEALYEAIVVPIQSAMCFAARGVINEIIKPKNYKRLILNQSAKIATGCPG
jgi:hypothetical protein